VDAARARALFHFAIDSGHAKAAPLAEIHLRRLNRRTRRGDASGATPGDRLPNKARAGLAGIAAVLLPIMDDGYWHRRQRAPSGVILVMREEMSGSTPKR
jgi:hypothetical protein